MRKFVASSVVAIVLSAAPALAADMVVKATPAAVASAWDIAFGGALMTDYNFRGISQSDRGPSVGAYFEPRFKINPNLELYAGIAGFSTKLATDPTGEFDYYAGIRPTFGALALDLGVMYYHYPREIQLNGAGPFGGGFTLANTEFDTKHGFGPYAYAIFRGNKKVATVTGCVIEYGMKS